MGRQKLVARSCVFGFDRRTKRSREKNAFAVLLLHFLHQLHAHLHTSAAYTNVQDTNERVGGRSFGWIGRRRGPAAVARVVDLRVDEPRSRRRYETIEGETHMKRMDLNSTANQVFIAIVPVLVPGLKPGELELEQVGTVMTHHVGLMREQKFDGAVCMSQDDGILDDPPWEYLPNYTGGLLFHVVRRPIFSPGQGHGLLQY